MGTRLRARITDCNKLSEGVQNLCGFTKSTTGRPCISKETEFDIWINVDKNAPPSFTSNERCFGQLFGLNLTAFETQDDKNIVRDLPDAEGVEITWFGNTPGTFKDGKCGAEAIQNIAGSASSDALEGYGGMISYFKDMGYSVGSTLFPMPYDWRRGAGNNDVALNLERTLELSFRLTSKKAVIVAHSAGGLNALQKLVTMKPDVKTKLVKR